LTWTVGSTAVATVTGEGPTVTLTGVHSGSTTIAAKMKVTDSGTMVSASANVKVNAIDDGTAVVTIQ